MPAKRKKPQPPVKMTFYLTHESIALLEDERRSWMELGSSRRDASLSAVLNAIIREWKRLEENDRL